MCKIIGGNHGLPSFEQKGKIFKKLSEVTLVNARSCLYAIVNYLKMPVIWMPSYLCESLICKSYNIKFYEVDKLLNINENFLDRTKQNEIVLVINYFGFPQDPCLYKKIKDKKCISIEDASQSLLSDKNNAADFSIYSLTKCMGLPDGGMIESNDSSFKIKTVPSPVDFFKSAYNYRKKRAEFDNKENSDWYSAYTEFKKLSVPIGPFEMNDLSKILYHKYDQFNIVQKTRQNYLFLQKHLNPIKELKEGVSPIGFSMLHNERNKLLRLLIENKIYPPIHWSLKQVPKLFTDSYWISERQITLPCDHRYDVEDMERIVKCVKTLL